jgi:hypothetical protein
MKPGQKSTAASDAKSAPADQVTAGAPTPAVPKKEVGGQKGPEPTRYGDWEKNGIVSDF